MVVEEAIGIRQLFGEERQKATTNLAKYIEQVDYAVYITLFFKRKEIWIKLDIFCCLFTYC